MKYATAHEIAGNCRHSRQAKIRYDIIISNASEKFRAGLTEDISDYDKDVGKSGYLDGHRLRNVFKKHQMLIVSLMNERAMNKDVEPADLASLDPGMRGAVVKLLDTLIAKNAADYDRAHAAYQRNVSRDPNCRDLPPERLTCKDFVEKLIRDFDDTAKGGGFRISAGAAGNEPDLFLNGLAGLLSAEGKKALADNREEIRGIVSAIFKKGTASDAGLRMSAVFKLLQAKFSIEVPAVMSGFQSSQERLTVAMESMLRTMTSAEVARLDVILAAARKDGVPDPEIPAASEKERRFVEIRP